MTRYVSEGPRYWHDPAYDGAWLWEDVPINSAALAAFKTFFADYDFADRAAGINMPVLAVMGRQDFIVPPRLMGDLAPAVSPVELSGADQQRSYATA